MLRANALCHERKPPDNGGSAEVWRCFSVFSFCLAKFHARFGADFFDDPALRAAQLKECRAVRAGVFPRRSEAGGGRIDRSCGRSRKGHARAVGMRAIGGCILPGSGCPCARVDCAAVRPARTDTDKIGDFINHIIFGSAGYNAVKLPVFPEAQLHLARLGQPVYRNRAALAEVTEGDAPSQTFE